MRRIYVDDSKCLSCHTCELACAVAHSDSGCLSGAIGEEPRPMARVSVEVSGRGAFPLQCRHCDDPQCVRACTAKALYRDSESLAVAHDEDRCIGCWMCAMACPFGSIECKSHGGKNAVSKCDLCMGHSETPACVSACPTGALVYEDVDRFSKNRRRAYLAEMLCQDAKEEARNG